MNVHPVNDRKAGDRDGYRSLMLLEEIAKGSATSQRDLSRRLDIALGLVNSFLKTLVAKGYVKIRGIPPRRYAYYLTPKGFAEKSRLTYHYLQSLTSIYHNARQDYRRLFSRLHEEGIKRVAFAGVEVTAEIAYLSLQEAGVTLAGAVDDDRRGKDFFGHAVRPLGEVSALDCQGVVVTTPVNGGMIRRELLRHGVPGDSIWSIHPLEDGGMSVTGDAAG